MTKKIYLFSTTPHPDAISIKSLEITFLKPHIDFSNYDYFIITSKQVSEFLKKYDSLPLKPALCVSKQTALSYESIGGSVIGTGLGYGDTLRSKLKDYSKDTKWIYLRAKEVASDFVSVAKADGYDVDEVLVYESICSQDISDVEVEDDSILVFTSPSSIRCFMRKNKIGKNNIVIVIGNTTAKELPDNINYFVSKEKTIDSCIELAKIYS